MSSRDCKAAKNRVGAMVHAPGCTKADVVLFCRCGANGGCRTCGYGFGAAPCACSPKVPLTWSQLTGGGLRP